MPLWTEAASRGRFRPLRSVRCAEVGTKFGTNFVVGLGDAGVACGSAWEFDAPAASSGCSGANLAVAILQTATNSAGAQAEICVLVIGSAAPDDLSAELGGVVDQGCAPNDCSLVIGVVGPDVAAFLSGDENDFAGGEGFENRR